MVIDVLVVQVVRNNFQDVVNHVKTQVLVVSIYVNVNLRQVSILGDNGYDFNVEVDQIVVIRRVH